MRKITSHAIKMLYRNKKSYLALSVTIIFSFVILLGYLLMVDSKSYNDYKELFATPRNVVMTYEQFSNNKMTTLISMVEENIDDVSYYTYYDANTMLSQYGTVHASVYFLPAGSRPIYEETTGHASTNEEIRWNTAEEVKMLTGLETMLLSGNQAVINESFYKMLGGDELTFPFELVVPMTWTDGSTEVLSLSVEGICEDSHFAESKFYINEEGHWQGNVQIYTSQEALESRSDKDIFDIMYHVCFCTDSPNEVAKYIEALGLVKHAVCEAQDTATVEIVAQKQTKGLIAILLLVILGINLFSSMSNVLGERQFEIGVKRAIGASSHHIVYQFLVESILVMLLDAIIATVLVAQAAIIYKVVMELFFDVTWVWYLSKYAIWMYVISCISITVLFSLILAYRATKVEIVKQLKSE